MLMGPFSSPVPARYVRHSQMCPQLDVSDKNDQKSRDMSDKARFVRQKWQKTAGYVRQKYFVFCWRFPEKTQIIPMCIHQAHACTLLLSSNMQLETYVAQLSSVLYYVLNKNGCIIWISRFKSHYKRLEVIIVSCQTHLAFCFHFCLTLSVGHIWRFFFFFVGHI